MNEVVNMLLNVREVLQQTDSLLDENKYSEGFAYFVQKISVVQDYLLFLANGEFLPVEIINQMSDFLLQAIEHNDRLLLRDVVKYAMLDVAEQLLEGSQEE